MVRRSIVLLACLAVVPLSLASTRVYTWKDAKGVVHYSQVQPENTPTTTKVVSTPKGKPVDPALAKAKSQDEKACERAKLNAEVLKSKGPLMADKDGDGKPEALSDAERKAAADLNERQVAAYCLQTGQAPAAPAAPTAATK